MKICLLSLLVSFLLLPLQANEIDTYFPAQKEVGQAVCSDNVFIRRTYLTLTGRLPQAQQVKQFLSSKDPKKRAAIIDELLDSEEYVRYMLMRWGDILRIKSEFPSNLWPNGVQAYNRWLYEKIAANTPYNQFVSDLLLSTGSNFRMPAVNFYRAFLKRTPEQIYNNICLLFLGTRTTDVYGRLCFTQLRYKSTKEWKEEIIFVDYGMKPLLNRIKMSDNQEIDLTTGQDWRRTYVGWLTSKQNKRFAGVMANRIWYWMMGNGIVHEPDDWSDSNLPTNPALLDFLTERFIETNYDVKALIRMVLNSNVFQGPTIPQGSYVSQRLPAEVIVDALADLTGVSDAYQSRVPEPFTFYPEGTRSVDLGDATVSSSTLELFGRVSRDVSLESQRSNALTSKQLLYLMNSSELEDRIRNSKKLKDVVAQQKDVEGICREITLMTLSRYPTPPEIKLFHAFAQVNNLSLSNLAYTILWTQLNSAEFLYNH